jgi:hypothetical protein
MSSKEVTGTDSGPSSPGRRKLLKGGVVAAIGLALVGISGPITEKKVQKLLDNALSRKASSSGAPAIASLSSLGDQFSLSEATLRALLPVCVPSFLPAGTVFTEARIAPDGNMVSLLYSNTSMEPLDLYDDGSVMAIYQIKEDFINGPPSYLPASFDRVPVNGNPGFGRGPSSDGGPGQLQWWSYGRRISIFANLDLPELIAIGSSMGDPQ